MKIKFHKATKTYSFGRYKYLTYKEAKQKEEKYHICKAQLWEGEELVSW
mgnify:CR=1 FL=1